MRVALLGVSHWHTPLYLDPLLGVPGAAVVGVSDPDQAVAAAYAERLGCASSTSFQDLCEDTRPDFVFALGRHSDMSDEARFLIEAGIPFAIEKPAGLSHADVAGLAARADEAGLFVAIPFVFRYTGFLQAIAEHAPGETVQYAGFRFIAGPPSRYIEAGCAWMHDAAERGGPAVNLGVHFLDLCRLLMPGEAPRISAAVFSSASAGLAIEDHSLIALQSAGRTCLVETGYLYPAPVGVFDMHFSVRTEAHYFTATGPGKVEVSRLDGERRSVSATTTNMPHYPTFVSDTLARLQDGRPPIADLNDMAAVMALLDEAARQSTPASNAHVRAMQPPTFAIP